MGHHLANVVRRQRKKLGWPPPFSLATVDMELSRQSGGDPKLGVEQGSESPRPDLVVHVRGSQAGNLLVVEFKASTNRKGARKDNLTIAKLVDSALLQYRYGVRAIFEPNAGTLRLVDWRRGAHVQPCALHTTPGMLSLPELLEDDARRRSARKRLSRIGH